jgi:hypothetical protein
MWKKLGYGAVISGTLAAAYLVGWVRGMSRSIDEHAMELANLTISHRFDVGRSFECGYLKYGVDRGMPEDAAERRRWEKDRCDDYVAKARQYDFLGSW